MGKIEQKNKLHKKQNNDAISQAENKNKTVLCFHVW